MRLGGITVVWIEVDTYVFKELVIQKEEVR
jgi:hypothetical protein